MNTIDYYDLTKQLSYFLFFLLFCFVLFSQIITKVECRKVSCDSHRVTEWSYHTRSQSQHMTRQSHDRSSMEGQSIATEVKCISSVENSMETLLSSPCQLRLGVDLSHHGQSLTQTSGRIGVLTSTSILFYAEICSI